MVMQGRDLSRTSWKSYWCVLLKYGSHVRCRIVGTYCLPEVNSKHQNQSRVYDVPKQGLYQLHNALMLYIMLSTECCRFLSLSYSQEAWKVVGT